MPDETIKVQLGLLKPRKRKPVWVSWSDDKLLDVRMCDLGVSIDGTPLERRISEVRKELNSRGIDFSPHFWLSDDWFTPDGVPGVAIPFYLAHPRLAKLEMNQMLEVEGGTKTWCLQILRHEVGHAIDNAFRLQRRRRRQKLFGKSSDDYPEYYTPRPYSKSFVLHLDSWYAQSHPDEDFAETFAVWLDPKTDWRKRYADWPALKKLDYMHDLMRDIRRRQPVETTTRILEPLSSIKKHCVNTMKQNGRTMALTDQISTIATCVVSFRMRLNSQTINLQRNF